MQAFLNTAVQAARRAGDIAVRALSRLDQLEIRAKARNEYVTQVDQAAEQAIIETLRKRYPDHAILAEESGASGSHDFTWIIDPLDGTTNFVHGFPPSPSPPSPFSRQRRHGHRPPRPSPTRGR